MKNKPFISTPQKKIFLLILFFISFCLFFTGCSNTENSSGAINGLLNSLGIVQNTQPPSVTEGVPSVIQTTPTAGNESQMNENPAGNLASVEDTPVPTPSSYNIELWVPPVFDPNENSKASNALNELIEHYTKEHPNVNISVRVKATSGDSSMINTLTSANHIAKDVLPSLAMISRNDLETAAQRNLLQPIDTSIFTENSTWYEYARESAIYDSVIYGIPILGNSWILTYRQSKIGPELGDWQDILSRGLPIGFAPSSSTSMFGLFMYLSMGGKLTNEQGQPHLDQQKLTDTLNFFLSGGQNGAFPPSIAQLVNQSQVWQRFNEGTLSIIISHFSDFIHYQTPEISMKSLPLGEGITAYPLVNTLNLVIFEDNPILQKEVLQFAEYMSDVIVNDNFSYASGYLPVRKADHDVWTDDAQYKIAESICENAMLVPGYQIMSKLVPVINNAVLQVIKNQMSPEDAANEALLSLN